MAEPRGFVVVGDTDHWDVASRHANVLVDSRLRKIAATASNIYPIFGSRLVFPTSTPLYAELLVEGSAEYAYFGVWPASEKSLSTNWYPGRSLNGFGMRWSLGGHIVNYGVPVQMSLGLGAAGDRMALSIRNDNGTVKVQFYNVSHSGVRTPFGTEVSCVTGAEALGGFYLSSALSTTNVSATLMVDGPDLLALPAGAQPWGAAARVADRGGYSPGVTVFTDTDPDYTIDAFGRVVSGTALNDGLCVCNNAPNLSARGGIYYTEFVAETVGATYPGIGGLVARNIDVTARYVGFTAAGFGYFMTDGRVFNDAVGVAYGAAVAAGTRIGVIWQPSSGKLYFSLDGVVQNGGDPEAGTGAAFTGVTGDYVPAFTPRECRIRICSHAREQLYRPAYAEAWDGADLLPEQYFVDRLKRAPSVKREVSYYPWANQRNRGAPIGNVDLINADGLYDALSDWDLRDQSIIAYRVRDDGSTVREFTGLVDGVTLSDARTCRVAVADKSARLDVRVESPVFALGSPYLIPARSRIGSTIAYDIAQSTFVNFDVYDQAASVSTWFRSDVGDVSGFERTVNPAGLHSVRNFELVEQGAEISISNSDFSSWSGGVPVDWAKWDSSPSGTVTQSGSTAIITSGGGDTGIYHAQAFSGGEQYAVRVKVDAVSGVVMGNVYIVLENSAGDFVGSGTGNLVINNIVESGIYTFLVTASAPRNGISIAAAFGASITVDYIQVWPVASTTTVQDAFEFLIEDEGGLSADDWQFSFWAKAAYAPGGIGYWSESRPTIRGVMDEVCNSELVDYYTDENGVIRLAWMMPPEDLDSSYFDYLGEIVERDVFGELSVSDDYAPRLSTVAEYQRNYVVHSSADVAGTVFTSDKLWASYVQSEGRENKLDISSVSAGDAGAVHPFYSFANDAPKWPRLSINDFSDDNSPHGAIASRDNRLIMLHRCYMQRRRFYKLRISRIRADELALRPGGVVELTHRRYGLSAGKNLLVTAIEPQLMSPTVAITLWG